MPEKRFAIAVSFPGEHRQFVNNVVKQLVAELGQDRVFYDRFYDDELVGLDGDNKLRRYYRDESEMVVPFFFGTLQERLVPKLNGVRFGQC